MARDITLAEVDQAEAELLDTKAKARKRGATAADTQKYKEAAQATADLRRSYREQEEAAGRRSGMVAT